MMRAAFIGIIAGLMFLAGIAQAEDMADFTGTWMWSQGQESFVITLKQQGDKVGGTHTAIGQQGAKADDGLDVDGPTIAGTVKGNVATVTFHTAYPDSDGHGTATMTKNGDTLDWEITSSDGEHYLPKKALMTFKP